MIKPESLAFLTELAANNDRVWFAENRERYEIAKANVLTFVEELIPLVAAADPEFPLGGDPKKALLRIYRDVRFSKNKNPYKSNYGIAFATKGYHGAEYYLQLQPGKSYFAAGYWQPESSDLKSIREEIDYNADEFLEIILAKSFTDQFTISKEDTLKNAPKGYDPEHPQIDLLKLKSFVATFPIADEELFKPTIVNHLKKAFKVASPFVQFLRKAVVQ